VTVTVNVYVLKSKLGTKFVMTGVIVEDAVNLTELLTTLSIASVYGLS